MRLDSRKVRWHRDRFGWTLDDLADKAGVAKGTLLRAEHGEDIQPRSGRRIAQAFDVGLSELIPEKPGVVHPKATVPLSSPPRAVEERHTQWEVALHNARQLRERGRASMEGLLSSWLDSRDSQYLRKMERLLQEAYDAKPALVNNFPRELTPRAREAAEQAGGEYVSNLDWGEIQETEQFYFTLVEMVLGAGLSVRRAQRAHEVKEAA